MPHDPLIDPDWALLARYFACEATRAETDEVDAWLAVAPERRVLAEQLGQVWRQSAELLPLEDVDTALVRIKAREADSAVVPLPVTSNSAQSAAQQPTPAVSSRHWRRSTTRWSQAAAALLAIGIGTVLWGMADRRPVPQVVSGMRMTDVATKRGERARLRLPDGSKVVLAPESRLQFAETFATTRRDLYLDGEAYFEAIHDNTKPFRVYTNGAVTEDIGTAFVVRAYPGSAAQVAVSEGAVVLETRSVSHPERIVLVHGERGTIRGDGSILHERGIDLGPEIAWTDGQLTFVNTPLREAIPRIGRWYDFDIHLADPRLGDLRLNATFDRDASPDVLHLVGLILDLRVERRGSSVVLYPKGAQP